MRAEGIIIAFVASATLVLASRRNLLGARFCYDEGTENLWNLCEDDFEVYAETKIFMKSGRGNRALLEANRNSSRAFRRTNLDVH